jgi:hypothetical protein
MPQRLVIVWYLGITIYVGLTCSNGEKIKKKTITSIQTCEAQRTPTVKEMSLQEQNRDKMGGEHSTHVRDKRLIQNYGWKT